MAEQLRTIGTGLVRVGRAFLAEPNGAQFQHLRPNEIPVSAVAMVRDTELELRETDRR